MVRGGNVPIVLCIIGWMVLGVEEVGALVYQVEPLIPSRLFRLILTGLLALTMFVIVRRTPPRVLHAPAPQRERGDGEPSTGDLAFGLGRQFERNLNGASGGHLRAVGDRQT